MCFTSGLVHHWETQARKRSCALVPWLSTSVQVGRQESGGRLKLSAPLTVIVRQQSYGVKHDFTSPQRPQQDLIDPTWHHRGRRNGEGLGLISLTDMESVRVT